MKQTAEKIFAYLELCKLRISLFASLSSLSGFLLISPDFGQQIVLLITGVFALASGACALNQYQERDIDALMPRTKMRPVPSGRIKPRHALFFSIVLISLGPAVLSLLGNVTVTLLGLLAVLWYNVIYTYLKRKTAYAAVPGAVVGALPPAMGSIAGGGHPGDPAVVFLCFFFFIWQIPHFWLLLVDRGEEYRQAGLPSLTGTFTNTQMARVIFNWVVATAVSCLFISPAVAGLSPLTHLFIFLSSLWLIWSGMGLLRKGTGSYFADAFRRINAYMLIVMAILSFNRFIV